VQVATLKISRYQGQSVVSHIYFVQNRGSGYLIKMSLTHDCPYVRLNNLRSAMRERHIELLGTIAVPDSQVNSRKGEIEANLQGCAMSA
jgi:hypothetical protein